MDSEQLKYPIGKFQAPAVISDELLQGWISEIGVFAEKLASLTEELPESVLDWPYRPEGWTIRQVVHHCADSHMNAFIRFKLALTEDNPRITGYQENVWAEHDDVFKTPVIDSIMILDGLHDRWECLLFNLSRKQLKRGYFHPEMNRIVALEEAVGTYAWHCRHHLAHIEQALKNEGKF